MFGVELQHNVIAVWAAVASAFLPADVVMRADVDLSWVT